MGGRLAIIDGLNPSQREAVRLEVLGKSATEIAGAVGVHMSTLSGWRHMPAYAQAVSDLCDEADRDCLRSARNAREKALRMMVRGLDRIATFSELSPNETATVMKASLDVYRVVAAQTGVAERRELDVQGRTEFLVSLEGLSEHELRILAYAAEGE